MTSMYANATSPRLQGAVAGLVISALLLVADAAMDLLSRGNPTIPTLLAPTLLAGTIGGALMGPRTVHTVWTTTWRTRFGIRIRLALLAVVIGDLVVAGQLALDSYLRASDIGQGMLGFVGGWLALAAFGLVLTPFAIVFTYPASVVWTWLMRKAREG